MPRFDPTDPLQVEIATSRAVFGGTLVEPLVPKVQIDAIYGLRTQTDHETFSATGGSATASDGLFSCSSGTSVGGYGVIRSLRAIRYRPGKGARFRFTALFPDSPPNLSLCVAGAFNTYDGLFVGYYNGTFGFMRRVPGSSEIQRLTLSAAAGGAETATVTLNGVGTEVSLAGGGTTTDDARELAAESYTGWNAYATGSVVTFVATDAAAKASSFSYSSTGTSAGTFAQVKAGSANDNDTGWTAVSDFNIDRLDGSGPSAMVIDPTKLNVYEISFGYLGAAPIQLSVMEPKTGLMVPAHRIRFPNANTTQNMRNPSLRLGWVSASLGSSGTDMVVKGASAAGLIEGEPSHQRNPRGYSATQTSVSTEQSIMAIRCRPEFGGVINQEEIRPAELTAALAGTKPGEIRIYLNPTLSAESWAFVDQTNSIAEVDESGSTLTGGQLVYAAAIAGGGSVSVDLTPLQMRVTRTETLVVTCFVSGGSGSDVSAAVTWHED